MTGSVGELWIVDFGDPFPGEPAHHRPAMIVGPPGIFADSFPFRIVVPLTATHRGLSLHVEIEAGERNGLDGTSYAQCELVRSINQARLVHRLGHIDAEVAGRVDSVLRVLFDH